MWQRHHGSVLTPRQREILRPMAERLVNRLLPGYLICLQIIFVASSAITFTFQLLYFLFTARASTTQALGMMRSSLTLSRWQGNNRPAIRTRWTKYLPGALISCNNHRHIFNHHWMHCAKRFNIDFLLLTEILTQAVLLVPAGLKYLKYLANQIYIWIF